MKDKVAQKKYSIMIHKMVLREPILIAQREKTAEVNTEARIKWEDIPNLRTHFHLW